jgi:hypothetical protein
VRALLAVLCAVGLVEMFVFAGYALNHDQLGVGYVMYVLAALGLGVVTREAFSR